MTVDELIEELQKISDDGKGQHHCSMYYQDVCTCVDETICDVDINEACKEVVFS